MFLMETKKSYSFPDDILTFEIIKLEHRMYLNAILSSMYFAVKHT